MVWEEKNGIYYNNIVPLSCRQPASIFSTIYTPIYMYLNIFSLSQDKSGEGERERIYYWEYILLYCRFIGMHKCFKFHLQLYSVSIIYRLSPTFWQVTNIQFFFSIIFLDYSLYSHMIFYIFFQRTPFGHRNFFNFDRYKKLSLLVNNILST